MALVNTNTECSLTYGKPEKSPVPSACIDGYSGQTVEVKAVSLWLEIRQLPVRVYTVSIHTCAHKCVYVPNS